MPLLPDDDESGCGRCLAGGAAQPTAASAVMWPGRPESTVTQTYQKRAYGPGIQYHWIVCHHTNFG